MPLRPRASLAPIAAFTAALLLATALPIRDARAQQAAGDVARATDAKKRGDEAMDSLRYADALAAYSEAYAATKDPALLYNKGRAYQALGDYPAALTELQRFEAEAPAELKARVPKLNELLAEVRARVATLVIHANVKDARILVRERVAGTTSDAAPIRVNAGRAFVEVGAEGYQTYRKEVELAGGQTTTLDVALVSKDRAGVLVVKSASSAGNVFVDGKPAGNAPVEVIVEAGAHKVLVRRDGYDDTESAVVVSAGERKELTVEPQKSAAITSKWWFWTSIGVVVVGGTVLTVALLKEKSAGSGDNFSPGQVSGPLMRF